MAEEIPVYSLGTDSTLVLISVFWSLVKRSCDKERNLYYTLPPPSSWLNTPYNVENTAVKELALVKLFRWD
jgi:hypothetical protein